jgi:hypothetical protein
MNPILGAGLSIGVLCAIWTFVMGFTGWYKDPVMLRAFFLVIPIEILGLIWGLRRTAAEGRTYRGQIVAGTLMAVVAGVIIICASLIFTTVAFPDYLSDIEPTATPMGQALGGFMGTLVTGILASAVIAIWVRSKAVPPGAPA